MTARSRKFPSVSVASVTFVLICVAAVCADERPVGFRVQGTTVPDYAQTIPIPDGFKELHPETHTQAPTWQPTEKSRGYAIFLSNTLEPVYPTTQPLRQQIGRGLEVTSARGEYEAASFSIRTLRDLEDVRVTVDDLHGPGGATIARTNVDLRAVRYLPRKEWRGEAYVVRPSFLERRESLTIAANRTQQYWLTVWVDASTTHGNYRGEVRVEAHGGMSTTLPLRLQVLPFRLRTPPTRQGMYYNPVVLGPGPHYPSLPAERLRRELFDMREHGMNAIFISVPPSLEVVKKGERVTFDISSIESLMTTATDAGIDSVIWNLHVDDLIDGRAGDFVTSVRAFLHGFQERGWRPPMLSAGDEADVNGTFNHAFRSLRSLKEAFPSHRIYTTIVRPQNSEMFEPAVDIRAFSSYADESVIAPTRKAGRELWMYSGSSGYGLDPLGDRLYRGFYAAKLTLDGVMDWTYWWQRPVPGLPGSSFNDFDGPTSRPKLLSCWVNPVADGPLPTPGWETMREGVEDGKYVFTVRSLIKETLATGDPEARRRAQTAQEVLDRILERVVIEPSEKSFPIRDTAACLDAAFFDTARAELAQQIELLSAAN